MRTIKLTISYDGTPYVGWQVQPNGISVQGELSRAIERMTGERGFPVGAGRTDAGVHAFGQVASFTTESSIPCDGFLHGLNSLLPSSIAILAVEEVPEGFDARRDAKGKVYRYDIVHSNVRLPLFEGRAWLVRARLHIAAMREAASILVGKHDFESFRASGCSARHAVRTIRSIDISRVGADGGLCMLRDAVSEPSSSRGLTAGTRLYTEIPRVNRGMTVQHTKKIDSETASEVGQCELISLTFEGDGFVRHMIRNIVGTLADVGQGKVGPHDVQRILGARERKEAGVCAPACGLYLVRVMY